jgi:hypothetical protein
VREFWLEGGDVHVTTPAGTDLKAKLVKTDKRSAKVRGILSPEGEKRGAGTWPFGIRDAARGAVKGGWSGTSAGTPPARYAQPVI